MIPESFIQDLVARTDIVDLIDGYVPLKKAGANFSACCPFHGEKTPSFTVSPSKQFYHCFGCGAHGTAVGFLMEYSGLDFIDAVHELARRAGMTVPQESGGFTPHHNAHSLYDIMAQAMRYYREQLKAAPKAIEYLKKRGLSGEICARFGVGYAPDGWQNLQATFPDYEAGELQEAGLVIKNENDRLYDRFRDRIMFPIIDQRGKVIAFGGRAIDQGEPKYLNSPETPIFEKGRELFGLPQARDGIRQNDTAIVVEGYMDVVALAQLGIDNAVAALGTATTGHHVHKLLRHADRIVFCFDGDNAGRKAAWRALENALEHVADNKALAFAFLPEGEDPDTYVRQNGKAAFADELKRALPLSEYLLRGLAAELDLDTAEGRSRLVFEAKPLLQRIKAPMLRTQIVRTLGERSGLSAGEVEKLCDLPRLARPDDRANAAPARAPRRAPSLARTMARALIHKPTLASELPEGLLADEGDDWASFGAVHEACLKLPAGAGTALLLQRLRDAESALPLGDIAGEWLETENIDEEALTTEFRDAVAKLRLRALSREIDELRQRAATLSSDEKRRFAELLMQQQSLKQVASSL